MMRGSFVEGQRLVVCKMGLGGLLKNKVSQKDQNSV
jgi:hypothetical protein